MAKIIAISSASSSQLIYAVFRDIFQVAEMALNVTQGHDVILLSHSNYALLFPFIVYLT